MCVVVKVFAVCIPEIRLDDVEGPARRQDLAHAAEERHQVGLRQMFEEIAGKREIDRLLYQFSHLDRRSDDSAEPPPVDKPESRARSLGWIRFRATTVLINAP